MSVECCIFFPSSGPALHSEEESESDSDLSMGSEELDSRAASPQLDDIKGERWAIKKYGELADNAVTVRFVLLS